MATKLFELLGTITVNNSDVNSKLEDTGEKVDDFHSKFKDGIQQAANWGVNLVSQMGTVVKNFALSVNDIVMKTVEAGSEIDKASKQVGFSAKAYQEWRYVLGQCSLEVGSLDGSMDSLLDRMSEAADPDSDGAKAFRQLGVAVRDSEGNLRSMEDVFKEVVFAMAAMEDGTGKNDLAKILFGGTELVPMLEMSSEGIAGLIARANELGLIMSDDDIASSSALRATMETVKEAYATFERDIGIAAQPALQKFYDFLLEIYPDLKAKFDELLPVIESAFNSLVDGLKWCIENKDTVVDAIKAIAAVMLTMKVSTSVLQFLTYLNGARGMLGGRGLPTGPITPTGVPTTVPTGTPTTGTPATGTPASTGTPTPSTQPATTPSTTGTGANPGAGAAAVPAAAGGIKFAGGFANVMSALTPLGVFGLGLTPALIAQQQADAETRAKNEARAAGVSTGEFGTNDPEILRMARIMGDLYADNDEGWASEEKALDELFGYDDDRVGYDPTKIGRVNYAMRMNGYEGELFKAEGMDTFERQAYLDAVGDLLKNLSDSAKSDTEDPQMKNNVVAMVDLLQTIAANSSKPIVLNTGALVGQLGSHLDGYLGNIVSQKARGN